MQHTWHCRRARGSFCTVTGGVIFLSALAIALTTASPSRADVPRNDRSRRRVSERSAKRPARATDPLTRQPVGTTRRGTLLREGRGRETVVNQKSSQLDTRTPGIVASPTGSTYSVHHQVGAMIDDGGGLQQHCRDIGILDINDPADFIVSFDAVEETLRRDVLGTTATVIETDTPQPDGSRLIVITTSSPQGTDLFPGGFTTIEGVALTDACFLIGLDDPLDWEGLDTVVLADIAFLIDGVTQTSVDIVDLFSSPWDGVVEVALADGAGQGYNGVRIQIRSSKNITPVNDLCEDPIVVKDGIHGFSTIGANTDGMEDFSVCNIFGFADIEADIWFSYKATCTGSMVVNLCDSAYNTKVAVYDGCVGRCPPDNPIACNDDWCGIQSVLGPDPGQDPVPVIKDECYTIRVGGIQGPMGSGNGAMLIECRDQSDIAAACCLAGDCTLMRESECIDGQGTWFRTETCTNFICPIPPPSNDECSAAIELTTGFPFGGTTIASTGIGSSSCGMNDSSDVWHSWTADCSGLPTFQTCGSAFDTTLSIFDGCGGNELKCNDDGGGCASNSFASKISDLEVTEGETYFLRVSGFGGEVEGGETGSYRLLVTECQNACCTDSGCELASPEVCKEFGGVPAIGRVCEGLNDDGVDFACAGCPPEPGISNSDPFTGTLDARRPYDEATPLAREGIGTAAEPILLLLTPQTDGLEDCFSLSETAADPDLGPNDIASAVRTPTLYELQLNHAIPAGETTTIEYTGDGSFICVHSHPGNVNADSIANWMDVISLMDCCLEESCLPALTARNCDIDRSGSQTPLDILTTIDLLLGGWDGSPKPSTAQCP